MDNNLIIENLENILMTPHCLSLDERQAVDQVLNDLKLKEAANRKFGFPKDGIQVTTDGVYKEKDPGEVELPRIMTQRFAVLNCLLEIASVAGDLYILEKPTRAEMSDGLRADMEDLTKRLKEFNEHFCFEF